MDKFDKIYNQESNESTAFILMLGEISGKLTQIINLLKLKKNIKIDFFDEDDE